MHCKPDDTTISQKIKETISELTYFDYHSSNRIMRKFELYNEHLMLHKK